jgi:hypothetical protein
MSSALNVEPPSPAKATLICEFLRLTGLQKRIDEGAVFDRFCRPGGAVFAALPAETPYGKAFAAAKAAVKAAYDANRIFWQRAYDDHVHWEFEEDELRQIVSFLNSAAGEHYQEALWRMDAYIATNTEPLVEQIVREACVIAAAQGQP